MKNLNATIAIFITVLLSACSSVQHSTVVKKPLISDHNLMLSLLNRPKTQDQQMMLALAQVNKSEQAHHMFNVIEIKGPKAESYPSNSFSGAQHNYRNSIAQDLNAVLMMGPK